MLHWLGAAGGKQPNGRFRPGIVVAPYAEHDLAHYVIDSFAAGLARSGAAPYLEYDPELEGSAAASADRHDPTTADLVTFADSRKPGVRIEVAPTADEHAQQSARRACELVAAACGLQMIGCHVSKHPFLNNRASSSWWISLACLDASADRDRLERADFLRAAGEALADARCRSLGMTYRNPGEGSVPSPGAERVDTINRTGWFAGNHPTIGFGAGRSQRSDPTAHLQTVLGVLVDGRFGYRSQSALQAAQRRHGMPDDGICGPATWAVLHSEARQGSVGYTTKEIQRELDVVDDGIFGPVTAAHVEAFQRDADTSADGRVTAEHYRLFFNP